MSPRPLDLVILVMPRKGIFIYFSTDCVKQDNHWKT